MTDFFRKSCFQVEFWFSNILRSTQSNNVSTFFFLLFLQLQIQGLLSSGTGTQLLYPVDKLMEAVIVLIGCFPGVPTRQSFWLARKRFFNNM